MTTLSDWSCNRPRYAPVGAKGSLGGIAESAEVEGGWMNSSDDSLVRVDSGAELRGADADSSTPGIPNSAVPLEESTLSTMVGPVPTAEG